MVKTNNQIIADISCLIKWDIISSANPIKRQSAISITENNIKYAIGAGRTIEISKIEITARAIRDNIPRQQHSVQ